MGKAERTTKLWRLEELKTNEITTTKYNLLSFIPKNLGEQLFLNPANTYFLGIAILQCIRQVSNSNGIPTTLFPLGFVVGAGALRDGSEDYQRYKSDRKQNQESKVTILDHNLKETEVSWEELRPGSIFKVKEGEQLPCDGLILAASKEQCFVETANLDGETNLKKKAPVINKREIRRQGR